LPVACLLSNDASELGARVDGQFAVDVPQVTVHRVGREEEPLSDLTVRDPVRDKPGDLRLSAGQRRHAAAVFASHDYPSAHPQLGEAAADGTFADPHALAQTLATELMTIEQVPNIPMFRKNTAAFVHALPASALANVDGDSTYVRVQVLTNHGALDRAKQIAVVARLIALVAEAAGDPSLADRTWVLLTEAPDGGWGLAGHANTNEELIAAARAQLAELSAAASPSASPDR
jgi:phenylpyruvate tautomerase PptA (4-oxalocrotonate tautomerase family)